ncbi:MAG: thiolase family protein [Acidimicrobiia bacterium]
MIVETPEDAWLIGGVRSPFGRFRGSLRDVPLVDLGRQVVNAAFERLAWPADAIDEFLVGIGMIEGGLMVPARQIAVGAGLPESLPTLTVDRACCSGATVVGLGSRALDRGATSVVCLGVETMSRTPRLLHRSINERPEDLEVEDLLLMRSPLTETSIARYVGEVAIDHGVDREMQDEWAVGSHRRYFAARGHGFFDQEVVAIDTPAGPFSLDEHPRSSTSLEALASLPTVRESPTITAGNAPGLNDGGCALVIAREQAAWHGDQPPLVRVVAYLQMAEAPTSSAYLPGVAIDHLVKHQGLAVTDLDVIEINEAYAATPLVSIRRLSGGDLGLEAELLSRTNSNGGAVALGHPVGASGARLILTAARQLHSMGGRWAAVAICGGFGQTDALLLERVGG